MTNFERQKKLDEQKWLVSEAKGYDNSGEMPYCSYCRWKNFDECSATQNLRENDCPCATAYNRMVRKCKK